jgi:hypothetical protein
MNFEQELKERMRLYELYSAAALTGYLSTNYDEGNNDISEAIDQIAKQMIGMHCDYSDRYTDLLDQIITKEQDEK